MNRWPALAEFRSLGVLAVPIIITQLAQMGMVSPTPSWRDGSGATDLAGIALGGNLYWPLMLLMSGIVMAVTPYVSNCTAPAPSCARRCGSPCAAAGVAVLLQNVEPAYRLLGVDESATPVAAGYLRAASLGPPAMPAVGCRRFEQFLHCQTRFLSHFWWQSPRIPLETTCGFVESAQRRRPTTLHGATRAPRTRK